MQLEMKSQEELIAEINRLKAMLSNCEERERANMDMADERFREALQSSRHVLYRLNVSSGHYDYISPYIAELTGYPLEVFRNFSWADLARLAPAEDRDRVRAEIEEAGRLNRGGEVALNFEYRLRKADGTYCWLHDWTTVKFDETGEVTSFVGSAYDITARKQAELELRESEERYRRLVEMSPEAIFIHVAGNFVYANQMGAKLLGVEQSGDLYGRPIWEFVQPDYHAKVRQRIGTILQEGKSVPLLEEVFVRVDGSTVSVEVVASPLIFQGMNAVQVLARDISERKQAEKTLREKEDILWSMLSANPESLCLVDAECKILAANETFASRLGMELKDVIGCSGHDLVPPELCTQRIQHLQEVIRTGQQVHFEDEWGGHYLDNRFCPIVDNDGTVQNIALLSVDITERKLAEKALQESEIKFRTLFETMQEGFALHEIICNDDGKPCDYRFLEVNKAFENLTGLKRDQVLGRTVLEVMPQTERFWIEEYGAVALHGQSKNFENFAAELGRHYEVTAYSPAHGLFAVVFNDVTERRKSQAELVKAQKLESLGILAGGIAHDFNNILTGIMGNLSFALMQLDPAHKIAKQLRETEKATVRARELTQQLLTFARGGEPIKKMITPGLLLKEAASFVLSGSNVKSVVELADDLWCINVDEGQITQVLHNLLLNAAQAMPEGGIVTVRAVNETISNASQPQLKAGNYLQISVEDHGCGIPSENLLRIFDPYFTTKPQGSGLGLASAYSIIKRHGGSIHVSSMLGKGTCFIIQLPAIPDICVLGDQPDKGEVASGQGRILLMDDEVIIREIAATMLEYLGYSVEISTNGTEAVERVREACGQNKPFMAVILDLTVSGGMGGKEAAALIRNIDPQTTLIVTSGYSNDPVLANYRDYGFSGAVPKPFNIEELAKELARVISR